MTLLSAENITVTKGEYTLLDQVSLHLSAGQLVGLIGPNGAGKSTLLRSVLGLQPLAGGAVFFRNQLLSRYSPAQLGRCLGYVAQGHVCHWPMTVQKIVEMGRFPYQRLLRQKSRKDREMISHALEVFQIESLSERLVSTLSGGERARVMLARAFAGDPDILCADEPTADLDPGHQLQVMNVLKAQTARGLCVVIVIHDLNLAARYCDHLVLLKDGQVMSEGQPEAVLTTDHLARVYGIKALMGQHENQYYILPWRRL